MARRPRQTVDDGGRAIDARPLAARAGLEDLSPAELRRAFAAGRWDGPTGGLASGFLQANLVILPREDALEFLTFCQRNPGPCPVVDVGDPGEVELLSAAGSDVRVDVPRYRVFRDGELVEETTSIESLWREDLVPILLGCSLTFESVLQAAGIPVRHIDAGHACPMYVTDRACVDAGRFGGPLIVTMRPIPAEQVALAVRLTAAYPHAHGAPIHIGTPERLGVDLARPLDGGTATIDAGDVPVFWACGVTSQAAAERARPRLMLTHAPGCMFLTDLTTEDDRA